VINDASFRILLIAKLIWELESYDETTFLHGELNEEICMMIPEGMNEDQFHCLQLKKKIYVLVQSAREFYKKLILVLKPFGFVEFVVEWEWKGSDSHPYVFDFIDLKRNGINLKVENSLKDYLNYHVIEDK
jgi:hypothetical protein